MSDETPANEKHCPVPVWDDGIYRVRCAMGQGRCAQHGTVIHDRGGDCDLMSDGYCRTHGLYSRKPGARHASE